MINLAIAADDYDHLHAQLKGILYGLAQTTAAVEPVAVGEVIKVVETITVEPAKKTRTPRGASAAAATADKVVTVEGEVLKDKEPAAETKIETPTLDDLRASLMSLSKAEGHGSEAVFALLGGFGAKNASTVPEDKRAAVIAAVAKKLEG